MAFRAARLQVTHRLEWLSWGVLHLFLCDSSFLHEMLPASVPGPKHAPALGLRVAVSFMMFGAFKGTHFRRADQGVKMRVHLCECRDVDQGAAILR